jgi:glycosyltransferase involved in cell wall biosynthesis
MPPEMEKKAAVPRVVYWNNQPSPYFVDRINRVVSSGRVEVEAWFDVSREPDRSWDVDENRWRFPFRYLAKQRILGREFRLPVDELRTRKPDLLVLTLDRFDHVMGAILALRYSQRVTVRYLPTFDSWSRRTRLRELSKHFLYRAIDGAKVPGPTAANQLRGYGMPDERMVAVAQGIDVSAYRDPAARVDTSRALRRAQEGLAGTVFIYVGRLWEGKGVQHLLKAFARLSKERPGAATLMVLGDGEQETSYRDWARNMSDVRFYGFVGTKDVPFWYAIADVLVFPTLGDPHGLVVEEAMSAGLPVIATTNAGDIRERVRDRKDGLIVPAGDTDALYEAMKSLVDDEQLLSRMKRSVQTDVLVPDLNRYDEDFETFVSTVLAMPARQSAPRWLLQMLGAVLWFGIGVAARRSDRHG